MSFNGKNWYNTAESLTGVDGRANLNQMRPGGMIYAEESDWSSLFVVNAPDYLVVDRQLVSVASQTKLLTDNTTNYVLCNIAGIVSVSTDPFPSTGRYKALAVVTTSGGVITAITNILREVGIFDLPLGPISRSPSHRVRCLELLNDGELELLNNSRVVMNPGEENEFVSDYDTGGAFGLLCDLSTAGAGGLDTGSPSPDTLYYLYLICDADAVTYDLIASLSGSSPTLPSGYTMQSDYLTAVVSNPAGDGFLYGRTFRDGAGWAYQEPVEVLTAGDALVETAINIGTVCPTVGRYELRYQISNASGTVENWQLLTGTATVVLTEEEVAQSTAGYPSEIDDRINVYNENIRYIFNTGTAGRSCTVSVVSWER